MAVAVLFFVMGILRAAPCEIFRLISRISTSGVHEIVDHILFRYIASRSLRPLIENLLFSEKAKLGTTRRCWK